MNQGSKPVARRPTLPTEAGPGVEFYSGRKVAVGEQVICELDAGDVAVYVLHR